ncbi:hypothetical protein [Virgibacillus sp. YIM 98842]|nr:hypothetical protein [Virgibacillus sp. YIM 98842]
MIGKQEFNDAKKPHPISIPAKKVKWYQVPLLGNNVKKEIIVLLKG